ncbi:hypothetical protein BJ742DRAFT_808553 [Cladochytrium replicatum]|nr:hypothetical protein BJ742DRAFT_808553 [Cladochytrium replicatum]
MRVTFDEHGFYQSVPKNKYGNLPVSKAPFIWVNDKGTSWGSIHWRILIEDVTKGWTIKLKTKLVTFVDRNEVYCSKNWRFSIVNKDGCLFDGVESEIRIPKGSKTDRRKSSTDYIFQVVVANGLTGETVCCDSPKFNIRACRHWSHIMDGWIEKHPDLSGYVTIESGDSSSGHSTTDNSPGSPNHALLFSHQSMTNTIADAVAHQTAVELLAENQMLRALVQSSIDCDPAVFTQNVLPPSDESAETLQTVECPHSTQLFPICDDEFSKILRDMANSQSTFLKKRNLDTIVNEMIRPYIESPKDVILIAMRKNDRWGQTILANAVYNHNEDVLFTVIDLLKAKVVERRRGRHEEVDDSTRSKQTVMALLEACAATSHTGSNVLHVAASRGRSDFIRRLIHLIREVPRQDQHDVCKKLASMLQRAAKLPCPRDVVHPPLRNRPRLRVKMDGTREFSPIDLVKFWHERFKADYDETMAAMTELHVQVNQFLLLDLDDCE